MRCVPCVYPLGQRRDAGALLARLRARRGLVALDSAAGAPRDWSIVAFDPLRGAALPDSASGLRAFTEQLAIDGGAPVPGPYTGGFIGALAYDLGAEGERAVACAADPWRSSRTMKSV